MVRISFNHHELLPKNLAMIISGRPESGKTYLLFHLLTTPGVLDFNHLMMYADTNDQFLYQILKHGFANNIKKEHLQKILQIYENNEELERHDIEEFCKAYAEKYPESISDYIITIDISSDINHFNVRKCDMSKKNLMCFDDCSANKDQAVQSSFFQKCRHFNCACIYLTHRFHEPELKGIRGDASVIILFDKPRKVLEQIPRDINLRMENKEFYQLAANTWANLKERKYLFINPQLDGERVLVSPF